MASRKERLVLEYFRPLANDIFKFCRAMNFKPTLNQQAHLLRSVQKGTRQIAVKSGQGPGKTTCTVIIGLWRLMKDYMAKLVVTAPTMRQCKDVWLQEARLRLAEAEPELRRFVKITKTKVIIGGNDDWCAEMVTATREENAQGYHRENLTVICEEASGISAGIITQFKGTLSNPGAMMIQIGNPTLRDSSFFDCFNRDRDKWDCYTFNAEETPESAWFSYERNRLLEEEFGRDSDVYRVRVLGQFPHTDPNCVISSELVEACTDRAKMLRYINAPRLNGKGIARQFGIDFARFGGDENTIYRRSGNSVTDWAKYAHTDPSEVVDAAYRMQMEARWSDSDCLYVADATGMGQGIMHRFHEAGKRINEYHNGGAASDEQYANKITHSWFNLAKLLKTGEAYLPSDPRLIQQLSTRQYYTNRKGKLILETKDEYLRRGHEHSPDRADGCVLAFDDESVASGRVASKRTPRSRGRVRRRVA